MLNVEQFAVAQKAQLEALLGLGATGLETTEKLVELNLATARAALADAGAQVESLMAAKDAKALLDLQAELLQPAPEKASAYGRKLYDIVTEAQSEMSKLAEAGAVDAQKKFMALFEAATKNAPAGSENAVAMAKAAIAAANDAFGNAQKAAKQAVDVAEANIVKFSSAAKPAAKARRA